MVELKSVKSESYNSNDLSKPLVITYDNLLGEDAGCKILIESLERNHWEYIVISINDTYRNHRDKLIGYKTMLETLHPDKIVVLTDSRDVICCRDVHAFIEGFNTLQSDFVVSLELFCDSTTDTVTTISPACVPLVEYWKHKNIVDWPIRKYVNSGLIAGKSDAILKFLCYAVDSPYYDDQQALGAYINMYPERIYGDHEAIILHSSSFGKSAGLENMLVQKHDSPTFAELLGRAAFFLHLPCLNTRGQSLVYKLVKICIENGATGSNLNKLYGECEYNWYQRIKDG